jgi:hypothetical protein
MMKELTEMPFSFQTIGFMGLFCGAEIPDVSGFTISGDLGAKGIFLGSPIKGNTLKSRGRAAVGFAIGAVLTVSGLSQIFKPVVRHVSIYVIDNLRPLSMSQKPHQSVSKIPFTANRNLDIAAVVLSSSNITNGNATRAVFGNLFPNKLAVSVFKKFSDIFSHRYSNTVSYGVC